MRLAWQTLLTRLVIDGLSGDGAITLVKHPQERADTVLHRKVDDQQTSALSVR